MADALHHLHRRKRIHARHEPYPHPDRFKRFLDKIIYLAALVGPVFALPQLYNIWVVKSLAGVSIVPWTAFCFAAAFWTFYGWVHNERPIIFAYGIWFVIDILIVSGILIYG